jgi:hypothetical protein
LPSVRDLASYGAPLSPLDQNAVTCPNEIPPLTGARFPSLELPKLIDRITEELRAWAGDGSFADDVTVVLARRI